MKTVEGEAFESLVGNFTTVSAQNDRKLNS